MMNKAPAVHSKYYYDYDMIWATLISLPQLNEAPGTQQIFFL